MTTRDTNDLFILARVSGEFVGLCASIGDSQWSFPTPAAEWNLDQLVDHVTGGNRFTVGILSGDSAEEAMAATVKSFDGTHESRAAALSSIKAQYQAFAKPGVQDRRCRHVAGELAGREVLRLRLHDLIIHTWDIAQALNPPATIPDELVAWALAELADPDSMSSQHFSLDTAGLERAGQAPQMALLSAFGRSGDL